jgi:hypothetical protein
VKETDKSNTKHIDSKSSQRDLPIYIVSLVGRVQLHGYDLWISHVTPYLEKKNEKTLLNGCKIKVEDYKYEIIMKYDSKEKMRSDGVLTTQQAFINPNKFRQDGSDRELLVS